MLQDLLNAMGSMHSAVLFLGLQNSGSVQPVIITERTVFYRERASRMYSALPYALALVCVTILFYLEFYYSPPTLFYRLKFLKLII